MEEKFREILDISCSGIKSARAYKRVREELLDHLLLKSSDYVEMGYSEDEAAEKAISGFGNPEEIKMQLAKEHPYNPVTSAKTAMGLIIIGFVISSFKINLFTGMENITGIIGEIFMLTGLMSIAKNGGKMKKAFRFDFVAVALGVLSYVFLPFIPVVAVKILLSVAVGVLSLIAWMRILSGFEELTTPFSGGTVIPYFPDRVLRIIVFLVNTAGALLLLSSGEENLNIESPLVAIIVMAITIAFLICTVVMLVRISRVLSRSEHDYIIEDNPKTKGRFAIVFAVCCVTLTMVFNAVFISKPAKTQPHIIDDVEISETEYSSIVNKMKSYGEDVEILFEILPKSEIRKLENIRDYNDRTFPDLVPVSCCCFGQYMMKTYCFELADSETERRYVRIIKLVEFEEDEVFPSRMGFRWTFDNVYSPGGDNEYCAVYNTATKDESLPFSKTFDFNNSLESVEFYGTKDTILCVAKTVQSFLQSDNCVSVKGKVKIAKFNYPVCGTERTLLSVLSSEGYQQSLTIDNTHIWDSIDLDLSGYSEDDEDAMYDDWLDE